MIRIYLKKCVRKGLKKKYIVYIDMQRDLKTKGLKEMYGNKNMQKDLKTKGLKEMYSNKNMQRDLKKEMYSIYIYIDMNKRDLKKLTKAQLIRLLLKQQAQKPSNSVKQIVNEYEDIIQPPEQLRDAYKPIPPPRTGKWQRVKPKPIPRKSVKQMVKEDEDIIQPPEQFRDAYKPIPKPRTDRPLQIRGNENARRPPKPQRSPPPPPKIEHEEPSSKIKELSRALKGHAKSYEVEIQDNLNPLNHFTKTKALVASHLKDLLKTMKGYKFIETLEVTFETETSSPKTGERKSIYKTAYFNCKAKTVTNANEIGSELSISQQEILNTIDIWVSEGSGWTIDKIDSNYINVVVYQPFHGSNYIDLPDELKTSAKGLINIKTKTTNASDGATLDI